MGALQGTRLVGKLADKFTEEDDETMANQVHRRLQEKSFHLSL